MGAQAKCTARFDGKVSSGTALLETDALVFRGTFRLSIPYKRMVRVEAHQGVLTVAVPEGPARFDLGAKAQLWADRIRNPKGLLDKLGVVSDMRVALVGVEDASFAEQLTARVGAVIQSRPQRATDLIFLAVDERDTLRRLRTLAGYLKPVGGIWVIAPRGSSQVPEADILAAGKAAGLVDVKVARFSETHTAHKFVIPRARRQVP
jgi:hypothetical protein